MPVWLRYSRAHWVKRTKTGSLSLSKLLPNVSVLGTQVFVVCPLLAFPASSFDAILRIEHPLLTLDSL